MPASFSERLSEHMPEEILGPAGPASAPPERPFGACRTESFWNSLTCGRLTAVAWSVPVFLPGKPSVGTPALSVMVELVPLDLSHHSI